VIRDSGHLANRFFVLLGMASSAICLSGCLINVKPYVGGIVRSDLGADCTAGCQYELEAGESLKRTFIAEAQPGNEFIRWQDSLTDFISICPNPTQLACELDIKALNANLERFPVELTAEFRVTNGYNANRIAFTAEFNTKGEFRKVDEFYWVEAYPGREPVNYYYVTGRSNNSLGLYDSFKEKAFFFDFSKGEIREKIGDANPTLWNVITSVSGKPNSWVASKVSYGNDAGIHTGDYTQLDNDTWVNKERGRDSTEATYIEIGRDNSSVLLLSSEETHQIELDIAAGEIYQSSLAGELVDSESRNLISIIHRVEQPVDGWNVSEIYYSDEDGKLLGRYIQKGGNNWAETSLDGRKTISELVLLSRNKYEISLSDKMTNVAIKLNLSDGLVLSFELPFPTPRYLIADYR